MKILIRLMLASYVLLPGVCLACDICILCTPIDQGGEYRSYFVRHFDSVCNYSCRDVPEGFKDKLALAIFEWRQYAAIEMSEVGGDWLIIWVDTSFNPSSKAAETVVEKTAAGDIICVETEFYSRVRKYDHDYAWNWVNTCPGPDYSINLYKVMLHEIGHAMGFCVASGEDPHPPAGTGSVMEQGTCYTSLQQLDQMSGHFLYQGRPESRVGHFTPVLQGGGVAVKWHSKYEYETSHFYIEKKGAGECFEPVSAAITASGSYLSGADYEYFDPAGIPSNIYRLIEVEKNGSEQSIGERKVLRAEPPQIPPIVLAEGERSSLRRDIAAVLDAHVQAKSAPLKVALSGQIHWLAIYPSEFSSSIAPLIAYRQYNGLNASGTTYEWIVANYGTVKAYLQYIWDSQGHELRYVLLVGDAAHIPIDHCHDGWVGGFYADYYTDAVVADVNNDAYPELSVGRIPASTADGVFLYVAKVLDYEGQAAQSWNQHVTFFVDDRDHGSDRSGPVAARMATELRELVPPTHVVHYRNLEAYSTYDPCALREEGIGEFNEGRSTVLCFGSWADAYSLVDWLRTYEEPPCNFTGEQLDQNGKCAFVLGASCDMGAMLDDTYPWIMKELMFATYRGAIACFASSGATWQGANYEICATALNLLYTWGSPTVGYACFRAQQDEMADEQPGNAHTARSYVFYGDPAIRLKGSVLGAAPAVTVSAPNGGEHRRTSDVLSIAWRVADNDLKGILCIVLINYDGGNGSWVVLASNVTVDGDGDGSYDYRVPAADGGDVTYDHCRIRVLATDACNNEGSDISNGDFTLELIYKPPTDPIPIDPITKKPLTPKDNFLDAPFPNPFNPSTSIRFGLKEPGAVSLVVYDVTGSVVRVLHSNSLLAGGEYVAVWDGRNDRGIRVSSGIYFLKLKSVGFSRTQRMILFR